jgi:hypothetical protein
VEWLKWQSAFIKRNKGKLLCTSIVYIKKQSKQSLHVKNGSVDEFGGNSTFTHLSIPNAVRDSLSKATGLWSWQWVSSY